MRQMCAAQKCWAEAPALVMGRINEWIHATFDDFPPFLPPTVAATLLFF